ncbi:MAG: hypothetical protein ACLFU2_13680 [Opitutales bacterium]
MELFPDWEVHPDYCEVRLVQLLTHLIDDFARHGQPACRRARAAGPDRWAGERPA